MPQKSAESSEIRRNPTIKLKIFKILKNAPNCPQKSPKKSPKTPKILRNLQESLKKKLKIVQENTKLSENYGSFVTEANEMNLR